MAGGNEGVAWPALFVAVGPLAPAPDTEYELTGSPAWKQSSSSSGKQVRILNGLASEQLCVRHTVQSCLCFRDQSWVCRTTDIDRAAQALRRPLHDLVVAQARVSLTLLSVG